MGHGFRLSASLFLLILSASTLAQSPLWPPVLLPRPSAPSAPAASAVVIPGRNMTVNAIAVDASDNVYLAGSGNAIDFPGLDRGFDGSPDGIDAFVAKIDRSGTVVWSTYLGGRDGFISGSRSFLPVSDSARAIAIDAAGQVYVAGITASNDFPTVAAFQPFRLGTTEGFIAKLSADGRRLLYSSYIGATGDSMSAQGIAVGPAGEAWIHALSPQRRWLAPTDTSGGSGASVVIKLGPSGTPIWSTRIGILEEGGFAVDGAGRAYIAGPNCIDFLRCQGFVLLRLDPSGTRVQYQIAIDNANASVYRASLALLPNGRVAFTAVAVGQALARIAGLPEEPCPSRDCGRAFAAIVSHAGQIEAATYLALGDLEPRLTADNFGRISLASNTRDIALPVVRPLVDHHVDGPIYVSRDRGTTFQVDANSRDTMPASSVADLVFNPRRGGVSAVSNGIYQSNEDGSTWQLDTSGQLGLGISTYRLAIDPRQPSIRYAIFGDSVYRHDEGTTMWRGVYISPPQTGDYRRTVVVSPHDSSVWIAGNTGVAVSANGGSTWTDRSAGLPNSRGSSPTVEHLAFDPQRPAAVYAMTQVGLYRTGNDGVTWEHLDSGYAPPPHTRAMAFDPITSDTLHVATLNHGLLKSTDAGRTWVRKLEGNRIWTVQTDHMKRHIVYAAGSDRDGHSAFFRSIDRGETWHRAGDGLDMRFEPSRLVVDARDSMRLYLGSSVVQPVPYVLRLQPDASHPARLSTEFATYLAHGQVGALAATVSGGLVAAFNHAWPPTDANQRQVVLVRIAP